MVLFDTLILIIMIADVVMSIAIAGLIAEFFIRAMVRWLEVYHKK